MVQSSLTQYGTYGFLSALLAVQVASIPRPKGDVVKDPASTQTKRLKTKSR